MTSATRQHMFMSPLVADLEQTTAMSPTARLAPYLMVLLALIGLADAFYDSHAIFTGQRLWCPPPIDGCNIVAANPYARVFDLPLGYLGVVYYLFMLMLASLLAFDPYSRGLRLGTVLHATVGVLASAVFVYIQFTFIHAFCVYCMISALLTVLLLVSALSHAGATRMTD
jgi:uncharacterized membrane protein